MYIAVTVRHITSVCPASGSSRPGNYIKPTPGGRKVMADVKKNIMTKEGLAKFEAELNDLRTNKRKEIAQKIKEAREQGDLSENAEYDAAKDEQRDVEARIEELENLLKNVEVSDDNDADPNTVSVGRTVRLYDIEMDEEVTYSIVGTSEVNSLEGKISSESPVGAALIGARENEVIMVDTPAGPFEYKVLEIVKK